MSTLQQTISADAAEARAELNKLTAELGDEFSSVISKLHGLVNRLEGNNKQLAQNQPTTPAVTVGTQPASTPAASSVSTPSSTASTK